jgi:hypothetical protein
MYVRKGSITNRPRKVEMKAVIRKQASVHIAVCQYYCFNKKRGITKYINE